MKNLLIISLFGLLCAPIQAQQNAPVQVPPQMLPVPVSVQGLPAGCAWSVTGGAQIIVTITSGSCTQPSAVTSVSVSGPSSLNVGGSGTYVATVLGTGTFNNAVTWSASAGTITPLGIFIAPTAAGPVTITATSVQDPTKFGTASVQITAAAPPVLAIGGTAQVATTAGPVRDNATGQSTVCAAGGTPGAALATQPNPLIGATVLIVAGPSPTCSNGVIYWQVKFSGGIVGWLGSDALIPLTAGGPTVAITWASSSSPSLLGYNVYRSTVSGGPYTLLAPVTPATVTAFTDATVVHGTKYFYVVTAKGDAAVYQTTESVNSTEASATP